MKRLGLFGARQGGYTIVETLIVFAASSALVLTVMILISGQQGRAQFTQAVRDADSRLQDTVNDFSTGFYTRNNDVTCFADNSGGKPTLTAAAKDQGKNIGCIYVGRVIRPGFGTADFSIHTLVGRQYQGLVLTSSITTDITNARTVVIHPTTSNPTIPNLSTSNTFGAGMELVTAVYADTSGTEQLAGPFGVISSFGQVVGGSLESDKQSPRIFIMTAAYASDLDLANKFDTGITSADYVVDRPLALCFRSVTSSQHAIIRFGTGSGSPATTVNIGAGTTCPTDLLP